jgi:uncharacterized Zn-finger protein
VVKEFQLDILFRYTVRRKPNKCSISHKEFSQKSHLITHVYTVGSDLKDKCTISGEGISDKSTLTVHMMIHTFYM